MKEPSPAPEGAQEKNATLCKAAFPGFELDFRLPAGFEDTSCLQNETPAFDKAQPDGTVLRLRIDYADQSL